MAPSRSRGRKRLEEATGAEGCCARCCDACRCSPLTCGIFISVGILVAATFILWFAAAGLGEAEYTDECKAAFNGSGLVLSFSSYLGGAGILVILLIFGLIVSGVVVFGLIVESLPKIVRGIAIACIAVPVLVLVFFCGWLILGTVMITRLDFDKGICQLQLNAIVYISLMWGYLVILVVIGILLILFMGRKVGREAKKLIDRN